jgi:hypothetical protein
LPRFDLAFFNKVENVGDDLGGNRLSSNQVATLQGYSVRRVLRRQFRVL